MEKIYTRLAEADLFAAIGTSPQIYPVATFVHKARTVGAHTIELKLKLLALVSAWVDKLLSQR
ncbi:hypothetical protein A9Q94_06080 [Rhodobacterales bacterium 56_14_T64]|nr:hypothetical protein A9Q94_06080 [Rhodobacterales bacterium 56_14_T64]